MIDRMMRAAKMDPFLYQEVERNPSVSKEALQIVVMVGVAGGISSLLSHLMRGQIVSGIGGAIAAVVLGVVAYYVWSFAVLIVGTKLFSGTSDFGEVSRCIAYAYVPNLLAVFGFVPAVGGLAAIVGSLWALVLGVFAIRQAMNFETGPAIATAVIAWIAMAVVIGVISAIVLVPLGLAAMATGR
ncbi:MAG: YIP1 family protein [Chloroflexota bacterium]